MRRALVLAAACGLALGAAHAQSQPAQSKTDPQCKPLQFTVRDGLQAITLDVAALRKERPELYQILQRRDVRDFFFQEMRSRFVSAVMADTRARDTGAEKGKGAASDHRARLLAYGISEAFTQTFNQCGSFIDQLAGELSVRMSKSEAEQVARRLAEPGMEKFLAFVLKAGREPRLSPELAANMRAPLLQHAYQYIRTRCAEMHLEPSFCNSLKPVIGDK